MLITLLAFTAPSQAAEIQVVLGTPIGVFVDGIPMHADPDGRNMAVSTDLAAGRHVLETRNALGKTTAYKELDLAVDDRVRFEYRKRELWHVNTSKMAMPTANTTVVRTTTTTTAQGGGGYDVIMQEGGETVHMGVSAGPMGGRVVVSDGQNTVAMDAGITVTETTTRTTTTTTTTGDAFGTAVVPSAAPASEMDPGSFNALRQQMDDAAFSDDKLSLLTTAVTHNLLSCNQLVQLLDTLPMSSDKVKAVGIAQPSVIDPQNAHLLNGAFSFSSDAQKAQAFFR